MTDRRRAAVVSASFVLEHVPDLVRYGSKPAREPQQLERLGGALRSFEDAVAYPPNQVFIGNLAPAALWDTPRDLVGASGRRGEHRRTHRRHHGPGRVLRAARRGGPVRARADGRRPRARASCRSTGGGTSWGAFAGDHELDESLTPGVLLENLSIKASGVHALQHLLKQGDVDPATITHAIGCGEEAVGDRYQRGGGNVAKAIAEQCGLPNASGIDVKSFCAAPVHALVVAAALIEAGIEERVVVVAGGSMGKLGMKFEGALSKGFPIIEDVLAGMAVLLEPADGSNGPIVRTDAVGRMPVDAGSARRRRSSKRWWVRRSMRSASGSATSTPTPPRSTTRRSPNRRAAATSPTATTRCSPASGSCAANWSAATSPGSPAPTACRASRRRRATSPARCRGSRTRSRRCAAGELQRTMLIAKGSLFLGRLTRLWDGVSVTLEA